MLQPRLATRAVILHDNRLLLVNAYRDPAATLWCAPGGGVERGSALPDNLMNEFHDPDRGFHQVEVFFRCTITAGMLAEGWADPEGIVTRRRFFTQDEVRDLRLKPDSLPRVAWARGFGYDPLELIQPA